MAKKMNTTDVVASIARRYTEMQQSGPGYRIPVVAWLAAVVVTLTGFE